MLNEFKNLDESLPNLRQLEEDLKILNKDITKPFELLPFFDQTFKLLIMT